MKSQAITSLCRPRSRDGASTLILGGRWRAVKFTAQPINQRVDSGKNPAPDAFFIRLWTLLSPLARHFDHTILGTCHNYNGARHVVTFTLAVRCPSSCQSESSSLSVGPFLGRTNGLSFGLSDRQRLENPRACSRHHVMRTYADDSEVGTAAKIQ